MASTDVPSHGAHNYNIDVSIFIAMGIPASFKSLKESSHWLSILKGSYVWLTEKLQRGPPHHQLLLRAMAAADAYTGSDEDTDDDMAVVLMILLFLLLFLFLSHRLNALTLITHCAYQAV